MGIYDTIEFRLFLLSSLQIRLEMVFDWNDILEAIFMLQSKNVFDLNIIFVLSCHIYFLKMCRDHFEKVETSSITLQIVHYRVNFISDEKVA